MVTKIPEDNRSDELITVMLPRRDYVALREIIERERTMEGLKKWLRNGWVWLVGGAIVSLLAYLESIQKLFRQ